MLSKWPIRVKFRVGLGLLLLLVAILSSSGLYTTYAYRSLVKNLSWRAEELPLAAELSRQVGACRITLSELRGLQANSFPAADHDREPVLGPIVRDQFDAALDGVEQTLSRYRNQLESKVVDGSPIGDNQAEWETVHLIEAALLRVHEANHDQDWMMLDGVNVGQLDEELEKLETLATRLPSHLHEKLHGFAAEVCNQYRALIFAIGLASVSAGLIFAIMMKLLHQWVIGPLGVIIKGSRRVAAGQFDHRIRLDTEDEMAELAGAMNNMTARFQAIRDDLDRQVQQRTREVVRSEQLASVGFLAAGVAHEINNPLASIAMSAESLEGRFADPTSDDDESHAVIANYLQMIQTEAFRCKGITEKLLDFSRMGPIERQNTELGELVRGVIEMVGHLGRYQQMNIEFDAAEPVIAPVNPQEIKQIVLNLLTNALDSLDTGGTVRVKLRADGDFAKLSFVDDGCGMGPEVLKHLFEPFYTRRRGGQGTGLGLSITYRIVSDHGGQIEANSLGPGHGATFRVRLPMTERQKEVENHHRAA